MTAEVQGEVSMSDLSLTMAFCDATTQLISACAAGRHIAEAVVFRQKSTGDGGQQGI